MPNKLKYKILYHHQTLMDGAEAIHIMAIFNAFKKMGHEIKMVSNLEKPYDMNKSNKSKVGLINTIRKIIPRSLFEIIRIFYNLIDIINLYFIFLKEKPDFIYKRHANFNFSPIFVANLLKIPIALEVNMIYWSSAKKKWEREEVNFVGLSRIIEKWIFKKSDGLIVVSSAIKNEILSMGIKPEKIIVLPNGVDIEHFYFKKLDCLRWRKSWNSENYIVLGFVGIMREWHGIEFLLKSICKLDFEKLKLKVVLIGDGEKKTEYIQFVKNNNIDRFVYFGKRLPHNEIPGVIGAFDICIMPASNDFGSPMKIIEYMAMSKAVIAPRLIPIEDIIRDGMDGLLFDPGDTNDLINKILLLVNNESLRKKIGQNARAKVERKLNWEKNALEVIKCLKNIERIN
ncbi:MAG: glycosyltransferase family 4 protein [Promethearchaeota archaeon]